MKVISAKEYGFTIIELLIAVAIVAILAAIALPSYTSYIDRARRADAKQVLMQAAQFLERRYTETGCYHQATSGNCAMGGVDPLLSGLTTVSDGSTTYYTIALVAAATTYTLTATRAGNWTKRDLGCGELSINQDGVKTISASMDVAKVADCWGR